MAALRPLISVLALAALAGCTTPGGKTYPGSIEGSVPTSGSFLPNTNLQLTPNIGYSLEKLAIAGLGGLVLNAVYQPLAPNWSIEEAVLDADTYYVRMEAKRFRIGGDGEAMMVLRRRARQLQIQRGYSGYRILDYSEGIESHTPVAQRFSEGIIQLVRADAPGRTPAEEAR